MSESGLDAKLERVVRRHAELADTLADPARLGGEFARLSKEYSDLTPLVERIGALTRARAERADLEALSGGDDADMRALAQTELAALDHRLPELEGQVRLMLLPKDEADAPATPSRNCAPAPAARKPLCSRPTFSACIRNMRRSTAGASR